MSSASTGTGQNDESRPFGDTAEQWGDMLNGLIDCGRRVVDRMSDRARDNFSRVQAREYDLEAWLDDVKWFWEGVAEDTSGLVQGFRTRASRDPDERR